MTVPYAASDSPFFLITGSEAPFGIYSVKEVIHVDGINLSDVEPGLNLVLCIYMLWRLYNR